jgi:hypothetical protein
LFKAGLTGKYDRKNLLAIITYLISMINPRKDTVEDSDENRQICRKYCRSCPSYKRHSLEKYPTAELFCARGKSSAPAIKESGCFCPACELFTKHHLNIGYFCVK